MSDNSKLICKFEFPNLLLCSTEIPSIMDVESGVWVNYDFKFTKMGDNKYWIPPSRIAYVVKEYEYDWKENIQKNMDDHLEYGTSLVCDPDDVDDCLEEYGYPDDNSVSQEELEKLDEIGVRWELYCDHGYQIGSEYCPQCRHKKGGPDQDNKHKKD